VYLRCDGVLVIRIAIDTNTVVVRDQCQLNIREFTYAEHRSSALCEPIVTLGRCSAIAVLRTRRVPITVQASCIGCAAIRHIHPEITSGPTSIMNAE
jgi:hypothetical protein